MTIAEELDAIAATCPLVLCVSSDAEARDFQVQDIEPHRLPEARKQLEAADRVFVGIAVMRGGTPSGFTVRTLSRVEADAVAEACAAHLVSRFADALNGVGLLTINELPKVEVQ